MGVVVLVFVPARESCQPRCRLQGVGMLEGHPMGFQGSAQSFSEGFRVFAWAKAQPVYHVTRGVQGESWRLSLDKRLQGGSLRFRGNRGVIWPIGRRCGFHRVSSSKKSKP